MIGLVAMISRQSNYLVLILQLLLPVIPVFHWKRLLPFTNAIFLPSFGNYSIGDGKLCGVAKHKKKGQPLFRKVYVAAMLTHFTGLAEPVGQVGQMPKQYFGVS